MTGSREASGGSKSEAEIRADLTGYAALLGASFENRIDLLQKVIREAHYPSLGRYKERLLSRTIVDYLPRTFEVGTGFVLFPIEDTNHPGGLDHHDPLNRSAFRVSRQCDILVYDSARVPPVFRDEDFVVVRPEAVRAVVEVKGALNLNEVTSVVEFAIDFARKWHSTQIFYKEHHQPQLQNPLLSCMAWRIQRRSDGRLVTTPDRVRERIASIYRERFRIDERALPILNSLLIYGEAEIAYLLKLDTVRGKARNEEGWLSADGRFVRFDSEGKPYRDGDRTIARLLASLHWATGKDSFNRFFSYLDETQQLNVVPYRFHGFSPWIRNGKIVRGR